MLTCQETYLFVGAGLLLATAAALYIASSTIELTTDSSEDMRKKKNGLALAGNILLLISGVIFVWKGKCIKKIIY